MKLKRELEEVLEEEEIEIVEDETVPLPQVEQDISYKLDVPRDVQGLVKLLEAKKGLEVGLKEIKETSLGAEFYAYGVLGVGFFSAIVSEELVYSKLDMHWPALFSGIIGAYATLRLLRPVYRRRSDKFEGEKAKKIKLEIENIQTIDQKLSLYDQPSEVGDIALVNHPELGYSVGRITLSSYGEKVLQQSYISYDHPGRRITEEIPVAEGIGSICRLEPSAELSRDDLYALKKGTPVLCEPSETVYPDPAELPSYGFFCGISERRHEICVFVEEFTIYADRDFKFPRRVYELNKLGSVKIRTLVPVIQKPASYRFNSRR